jgi:peptide/nickel transport system substrate-binding protein
MGEAVPTLEVLEGNSASYEELWRQVALEMEGIGVDVKPQFVDWNTWIQQAVLEHSYGSFTVTGAGMTDERLDPNWRLENLMHSKRAVNGGSNYSEWKNPDVDALIDAQAEELDRETRRDLIFEIQEHFAEEQPFIPVYFINDVQCLDTAKFEGALVRPSAGILRWNNFTSFLNIKPKTDETLLKLNNDHDGNGTNPFIASGGMFNTSTMLWIYDTLARFDENLEILPWAAESWDFVDNTTVDVKLREGMTFHDGVAVTADDLVFTVNLAKENQFSRWLGVLDVVDSVEKVDDLTVRFNLTKTFAAFESSILTFIFIVPKHLWEDVADPLTYENPEPIGSGPWTFGHWRKSESWLWERNPDHWNPPNVDVLAAIVPSVETWIGMLETGELHGTGIYIRGDEQIDRIEAIPNFKVWIIPGLGVNSIYIKLDMPPGSDLAFRKAMHHLVPKARILDVIAGKGGGTPAGSTIFHPESYWHNPDLPEFEYNPDKAREILADAGYTWDDDGMLHYPA